MPSYGSSYGSFYGSPFRGSVTRWVRRLLIANTAIFVAYIFLRLLPPLRGAAAYAYSHLALQAFEVPFRPWTLVTYAFLHAGPFHLLFNMVALFFFGPRLEDRWGSRSFLKFYLIAAAGGAVFSLIEPHGSVVGASAAVNGLLMAWALYWPDEEVLVLGIFPAKMKWLVLVMGAFSVLSAAGGGGSGVAHFAHIGGFVTAFAYLKSRWAPPAWGDLPARPSARVKRRRAVVPWQARKETAEASAPASAAAPVTRSSRAERELLDDVDRILEKISAEGLGSLTPEERERLDEVSRRYRTN